MKVQLICTLCKEMITESGKGIYIWGEKDELNSFKLVHKGACDSFFQKSHPYSCEIHTAIKRIGATPEYRGLTKENNETV